MENHGILIVSLSLSLSLVTGLLGVNGAGKSTTVSVFCVELSPPVEAEAIVLDLL